MLKSRESGVLLHISSLPSKYGIGTLGKEAYNFIDFLTNCGVRVWQILPLTPTGYGNSPYSSVSSKALNPYLIDLESLVEEKLISLEFINSLDFGTNPLVVDFDKIALNKMMVLKEAYINFDLKNKEFIKFVEDGKYTDYAAFMTLKNHFNGRCWNDWPSEYRFYNENVIKKIRLKMADEFNFWQFTQYIFLKQWSNLHEYAKAKNVKILGDMPLYVSYDSADVWTNTSLFQLDKDLKMTSVAGVPPDAFSSEGQLWGNPLYDYKTMALDDYSWWKERMNYSLELLDLVRIDHFRGFDRYYKIKGNALDAKNGKWVKAPGFDLFKHFIDKNIIAEDLGIIDEGVLSLLEKTKFPGMRVLQFALDNDEANIHKPSNVSRNSVAYTGTHDNMTSLGFYESLKGDDRMMFFANLRKEMQSYKLKVDFTTKDKIVDSMIELCLASKSNLAIIPLQDYLHLDNSYRMNEPSTVSEKNWAYRSLKKDFSKGLMSKISRLIKKYER